MNRVFLSLGGNLGDRLSNLRQALHALAETVGELQSMSSIYETEAWGGVSQPDYLNLAVIIKTDLKPLEVLEKTQAIEKKFGRIRKARWEARTVDIDILFYNGLVFDSVNLSIPHPLIAIRKFVLMPLMEIAPDFEHPVLKIAIKNLYSICKDNTIVKKLKTKNL